ncbi:PREDICTED: uncharacterized protein LOC106807979 [Priapulus caudatus]|uniref:Uncharacterized protein LOC106807979 n=1 Tax=Priapulus caudatus TaxID=37621 RepID=A0ABM1E1D1_PRICU|nr:PREDICTED: uncharacterized protein LOC106807979 [Priapulus caudatus]
MAQCLYDCLHGAKLGHLFPVLQSKGVLHSEGLAEVSLLDYGEYGITQPLDQLRLFRLIQLIREVRKSGKQCKKSCLQKVIVGATTFAISGYHHNNVTPNLVAKGVADLGSGAKQKHQLTDDKILYDGQTAGTSETKYSNDSSLHGHNRLSFTDAKERKRNNNIKVTTRKSKGIYFYVNLDQSAKTDASSAEKNLRSKLTTRRATSFVVGVGELQQPRLKPGIVPISSHSALGSAGRPLPCPGYDQFMLRDTDATQWPLSDSESFAQTSLLTCSMARGAKRGFNIQAGHVPASGKKQMQVKSEIKVFVRIAPSMLTAAERPASVRKFVHTDTVIVNEVKSTLRLQCYNKQHIFKFSNVFDETIANKSVYEATIKPSVHQIFSGKRLTVVSYGQVSSGKTYTIHGKGSLPGLYRQAASDVFAHLGTMTDGSSRRVQVFVSFCEVLQGRLLDLLNSRNRVIAQEQSSGVVLINGLKEVEVLDIVALQKVMENGLNTHRRQHPRSNGPGSTWHTILQLRVTNAGREVGKLAFVDLASCEQTNQGKQRPGRVTEIASVNQDFLVLRACIHALQTGSRHTPFRQSKLAMLLRNALLFPGETVVLATLRQEAEFVQRTIRTLQFADSLQELVCVECQQSCREQGASDATHVSHSLRTGSFHVHARQLAAHQLRADTTAASTSKKNILSTTTAEAQSWRLDASGSSDTSQSQKGDSSQFVLPPQQEQQQQQVEQGEQEQYPEQQQQQLQQPISPVMRTRHISSPSQLLPNDQAGLSQLYIRPIKPFMLRRRSKSGEPVVQLSTSSSADEVRQGQVVVDKESQTGEVGSSNRHCRRHHSSSGRRKRVANVDAPLDRSVIEQDEAVSPVEQVTAGVRTDGASNHHTVSASATQEESCHVQADNQLGPAKHPEKVEDTQVPFHIQAWPPIQTSKDDCGSGIEVTHSTTLAFKRSLSDNCLDQSQVSVYIPDVSYVADRRLSSQRSIDDRAICVARDGGLFFGTGQSTRQSKDANPPPTSAPLPLPTQESNEQTARLTVKHVSRNVPLRILSPTFIRGQIGSMEFPAGSGVHTDSDARAVNDAQSDSGKLTHVKESADVTRADELPLQMANEVVQTRSLQMADEVIQTQDIPLDLEAHIKSRYPSGKSDVTETVVPTPGEGDHSSDDSSLGSSLQSGSWQELLVSHHRSRSAWFEPYGKARSDSSPSSSTDTQVTEPHSAQVLQQEEMGITSQGVDHQDSFSSIQTDSGWSQGAHTPGFSTHEGYDTQFHPLGAFSRVADHIGYQQMDIPVRSNSAGVQSVDAIDISNAENVGDISGNGATLVECIAPAQPSAVTPTRHISTNVSKGETVVHVAASENDFSNLRGAFRPVRSPHGESSGSNGQQKTHEEALEKPQSIVDSSAHDSLVVRPRKCKVPSSVDSESGEVVGWSLKYCSSDKAVIGHHLVSLVLEPQEERLAQDSHAGSVKTNPVSTREEHVSESNDNISMKQDTAASCSGKSQENEELLSSKCTDESPKESDIAIGAAKSGETGQLACATLEQSSSDSLGRHKQHRHTGRKPKLDKYFPKVDASSKDYLPSKQAEADKESTHNKTGVMELASRHAQVLYDLRQINYKETQLLSSLRDGSKDHEQYLQELQQLLCSKEKSIHKLMEDVSYAGP